MYSAITISDFHSLPPHPGTGKRCYDVPDPELKINLPITIKPSQANLPKPFSSCASGEEPNNVATVKFICVAEVEEQQIRRTQTWHIRENDLHLYRGHLSWANDDTENVAVICKMAYEFNAIACLKNEAHIYTNELNHLQGKCIPYFYGMFANKEGTLACTILQNGGDAIEWFKIEDPSLDFKKLVLKAVLSIHAAGVYHSGLIPPSERHVLLSQSPDSPNTPQPMIVDFKYARSGHKCLDIKREWDEFRIGDWAPSESDIYCHELCYFLKSLSAWIPHYTTFHGARVRALFYQSEEILLEYLRRTDNIHLSSAQEEVAETKRALEEFNKRYGHWLENHQRWPENTYESGIYAPKPREGHSAQNSDDDDNDDEEGEGEEEEEEEKGEEKGEEDVTQI
ncbi:hypothetical protein QCA50_009106 [Cerrena zonata]|uniref:Protein kinase domain-containing protein n=1 Tax=Cerrena zonata TaxID=2478898 RepID=A0AAW0G8M1_9APHY